MVPTDTGRLLLRPEEAAEALGLSRSTVYELIASGALASVKIASSRRITRDALEEYVAGLASQQSTGAA